MYGWRLSDSVIIVECSTTAVQSAVNGSVTGSNPVTPDYKKGFTNMKQKPNLFEERMNGWGGQYNNSQNYIKGLDDMCIFHNMNDTHNVLELGVNDGVSTTLFAYYAKSVTGVDIHKSQKLENNLNLYNNIIFKNGDIELIVPELMDNYFDFAYIDAAHDRFSVLRDIKLVLPKLKTNGIICGHDYIDKDEDHVYGAVNEVFKNKKINVFEDTSWSIEI